MLSEHLNWAAHFESVTDNPYLSDFYDDMERWSFPLQIYFLNHRFKAHREILQSPTSAIQDRSIYEDAHIFARNLYEQGKMLKRDYLNYMDLYNSVCQLLQPPDLMVYLRKSIPRLKAQIALRGRNYEKNIPEDYLLNLNQYYEEWIVNYHSGNKLIIDSDSMDFLNRSSDFEIIVRLVLRSLQGKTKEIPETREIRQAINY